MLKLSALIYILLNDMVITINNSDDLIADLNMLFMTKVI